MWSHFFLPSLPLSVSLPPFLSGKDLVSSPFKSVVFNLDCALESPGNLDQILMPRPGPGPMNSDSLGKSSGNSIFKSPWLIPTCSQDQQALPHAGLGKHSLFTYLHQTAGETRAPAGVVSPTCSGGLPSFGGSLLLFASCVSSL